MYRVLKETTSHDSKSQTLLSTLVHKHDFDAELLQYELARYQRENVPPMGYYSYFGIHLADIYENCRISLLTMIGGSSFQKHIAQRYMLMVNMIGVSIAVFIEILDLGISGFQAYTLCQQWKHPVNDA
ncbi:hypothetical protein TUN199_05802 [Pyrenophora tritici-repentis]|nr:hypothetical protein Alg215_06410 [Pyrenophora tritici-repentis]KAI0610245.1 hypothetical protein TUN205_05489 [Pyrenophora tritici-repentis]KAI0622187.1 hypothetical protein TUN199_05802 [Pyrenophora tritici-repentis]PZC94177.1 hypothetical protein A1F95_06769 [Pyrenophora tritici-repentis]PZD27812.1 hypothetical protein A1F96_06401 [Pyrenophora tritici-repentis]